MKRQNIISLWTSMAMLALTGVLALQAQNSAPTTTEKQGQLGKVQPAKHYISQDLKSQSGEKLGKVEDFIVDLESGRILYAIVNASGSSRGVPVELIKPAADQNSLTVSSDKQHVDNAPAVPKGDAAQLSSAALAGSIAKYFNQTTWYQQGNNAGSEAKDFGNAQRVSQLANMEVRNSSDDKVGKVEDAVLDLNSGYVTFVMLDPSQMLGQANQKLAVPPNAFTKGSGNFLVTGLDKEILSGAPKFNNNWADLSDMSKAGSIYSYYGKQPYWNLSPTGRE
ncbi:MAG: antigen [Verrucomicrobiales bacterium]|nr:antigen [Verrucomicrobiales bacterium]